MEPTHHRPARSSVATTALKLTVRAVCLLGLLAMPVMWFLQASPSGRWGFGVLMGAMVTLGLMMARFPQIEHHVDRFGAWARKTAISIGAAVVPMGAFRWVAGITLSGLAGWLVTLILSAWGLLLVWALQWIGTERGRTRFFRAMAPLGVAAPLLYAVNVVMVAIIFFATLSVVMYDQGWVTYTARPGIDVALGSLMDFYLWHVLDAIPALAAPQTLRWENPLSYPCNRAGWLLLVFKLTVIMPTIAVFIGYWRRHTTASD